jgi:type IV pilus assembly protein PilA
MLATLRKRHEREDEGFTLIELMVVVLIIAILLAIAIPTFLGARNRANDRAAQSSLRNALTAAKTIFTDNQSYSSATTTALGSVEPSLTYSAANATSTDPKIVSVDGSQSTGAQFYAAAWSKSGQCFMIKDASGTSGGTTYYKADSVGGANCSASDGVAASSSFASNGW